MPAVKARLRTAAIVYVVTTSVFALVSWDRLGSHSPDNHFVYLADAIAHGRLHLDGEPPSRNDWARYEGRWYVSFPPFPAFVMLPGVAIFGKGFLDRLFAVFFTGLGPALAFLVLRALADRGDSKRTEREDLLLIALLSFGTVYFFSAVQGSVWYVAHVFALPLVAGYVLASLDARRPVLAGALLGCAFLTRPTLLFAAPFFLLEAWRLGRKEAVGRLVRFAVPLALVGALTMWLNHARFGDPLEFGHRFLVVRWTARIERWGLFNYHFLAKNLAAALVLLPWLTRQPPYVKVSNHGLSLLVTTPVYAWLLWPKERGPLHRTLWITTACVAIPNLLYQNTGWVQFGYRFSNDYSLFLVMLLAIGARPFGRAFRVLCAVAIAVNLFGALTFDRVPRFYDSDMTARNVFQPD
jgi:hypothetical protein